MVMENNGDGEGDHLDGDGHPQAGLQLDKLLRSESTVPVVDLLEQSLQDFGHFRVTFHLHYENFFSVNLIIFIELPDLCQRRRFS